MQNGFFITLFKALTERDERACFFAKAKKSFDKLQEFIDNFKFCTNLI